MATESVKLRIGAQPPSQSQYDLYQLLVAVQADLAALTTNFNTLRTEINGHTHGGVTAGAANTSAMTATASSAVSRQTNA